MADLNEEGKRLRRLLFETAYQGTRYHGYQVQKNAVTVAGTIQDAVEKVWGCREGITGCSRTDTGVHARQFFFHMDTQHTIPTDAACPGIKCQPARRYCDFVLSGGSARFSCPL